MKLDESRIFADRDFENMMYQVHKVPKGEQVYPKFKGMDLMPSFAKFYDEELNKSEVIKYVVYCYDRNSPIFIKFQNDDLKRKTTAAAYAGFKYDEETGLFDEHVDRMMKGMNRKVNQMIVDYIRQYNDPEYSLLVSGYEALYQKLSSLANTTRAFDPDDQDDLNDHLKNEELKGKLFEQAMKMTDQINKLSTKILTDENKFIKRDLYSMIDKSIANKLKLSPEAQAGLE